MNEGSHTPITERIERPTLLLDEARALRNIERMIDKAEKAGVRFRPHFKTHQSAEIGTWFAERGVRAITVSSLSMAHYFANHGWSDITVAFPVNLREMELLDVLARSVTLGVLVDAKPAVELMEKQLPAPLRVWIKIDAGYGRAGVIWHDHERIAALAERIQCAERLELAGLLVHSGNTYAARSSAAVREIHAEVVARLQALQTMLQSRDIAAGEISIGDTPSCSLVDDFNGVDEIRPGNFVFHDLMQQALDACADPDIAVGVACPVVGVYPERGEIVIYGGAVHFGKESLVTGDGRRVFGYLREWVDGGWGGVDRLAPVVSLSQEHGIVQVDAERLGRIEVGDLVHVAPVHSCLTCNLHETYMTLSGAVIARRPR